MKDTFSASRYIAGEEFQRSAVRQAQIEMADETKKQSQAVFELIYQQQEANQIQRQSNELMQKQIEFLRETNAANEKALKTQKTWSFISWVITTLIAVAAVIAQFLTI